MDVLGVDIGRVVSDNSFPDCFVPGAINALASLIDQKFGEHVHFISKCGQGMQDRTLAQFDEHCFYERTGIDRTHIWFCRERPQKVPIAARLGLTHFIDDRLQILGYLRGTVGKLYLFRPQAHEVRKYSEYLDGVEGIFNGWDEALPVLLNS